MNTSIRRIAINRYIPYALILGIFFSWMGIEMLADGETAAGIVSLIIALICIVGAPILLPIYYSFDPKGVTFCYLFLPKERYLWSKIQSITVSCERRSPNAFELEGKSEGKKHFYMDGKIPRNRRTKKLLEAYWDGTITGYPFEDLRNWWNGHKEEQGRRIQQYITDEVVPMERDARAQARTTLELYEARAAQLGLKLRIKFCYTTEDLDEQNTRPEGNYTYTVLTELYRPDQTDENKIIIAGADLLHVRLGKNAYRGVPDEDALTELRQELDEILQEVQKHGLDAYCQENLE